MADTIKGAVLGYGAAFNMGRAHANMMQNTDGIECVAVCDIDSERTDAAKKDFPSIRTYNSVEALNADDGVDLIANVLPHSLHCGPSVGEPQGRQARCRRKTDVRHHRRSHRNDYNRQRKRRYVVRSSQPTVGC